MSSFLYDITEHKRMEETIKRFAFYDPLTELPNRLLFNDRAEHALSSAGRYGRKVAVMVMDIDDFKQVNDTYGHDAGDEVLQDISLRFSSSIRRVDTVSRLGGDEFVVLLPEIPDESTPENIARRIIEAMSHPFKIQGKDIRLSVSIGYAIYPGDATDLNLLVKSADRAMYHSKRNGFNNYERYTPDMNGRASNGPTA
jgi:diguanylate cyclase (GGDEF)-like protein